MTEAEGEVGYPLNRFKPPSILILTVPRRYFRLWFLIVTCSCCPYLYYGSAIMLVTYFVNFRYLNDHLFGKELIIRFTFRKLLSVYVFSYFPFGFDGRMWDLIVSVPDHCLSFYFRQQLLDTVYDILNIIAKISDLYMSIKSHKIGEIKSFLRPGLQIQ